MSSLLSLSFLTPLALALSALAIPIILLYMLRLRRTETPISSTFLWQQLLRDREANAPWQRLRPNLLLFLQLLILAALVVALARPFTEVSTITSGRIVLLLDGSASMRATDVEPDRFATARQIALDMVDTLGPDDTMTVIQVGAVPEVLAAASRDRLVLRQAIRSAEARDVSADWLAAMTLAAAGGVGVDELKVVIVSDGGLPPNLPPVPGDVRFVPVGKAASNLAISALATASLPGKTPQLFAQISNYGDTDAEVILDARLNASEVIEWAYRYTVPARGHVDIFEVELPETFDTLTANLTLPSRGGATDYLAVDNVAYTVRDRSGAGQVLLVSAGDNLFLRQILRSLPGVDLSEVDPAAGLPQQEYDLYVFEGWLPDSLPDGDLLIVNPPRGTDFFTLGPVQQAVEPIAVHADDPRTRNLDGYVSAINLRQFRETGGTSWGTVLAQTGSYPLVVAGEIDGRQVALLPFDASYPNTDLVLQPAWPILIAELANWFSPPRALDMAGSVLPGTPVTVRFIEGADEVLITRPDGKQTRLKAETSETAFVDTLQPGLYRVDLRRSGDVLKSERFAVNLFDPAESQIEPQKSVVIGTTTISRDARKETGRREWWPWIVGLALLVLAVEWWIYHRSLRRIPRITLAGLRSTRLPNRGGLRDRRHRSARTR